MSGRCRGPPARPASVAIGLSAGGGRAIAGARGARSVARHHAFERRAGSEGSGGRADAQATGEAPLPDG